ncbi:MULTISPECIES: hypothetical protein [Halorussus]|uniref:hypothetical protein n=1 Tax=Halorussus TaxID=1070314 RepID=UPI0020A0D983|nr:hypothetical protein [Halorussus vallis]USZ74205.1 hypothetical protein NGM07_12195 [Halorussus vallis]
MSRESDAPGASGGYDPSLRAKLVGGVQWAVTGYFVFALAFFAVGWYLRATRAMFSLSVREELVGFLLAAFVGGYGWVALRTRSAAAERVAHVRRIEVVVTLLVLGFFLPVAAMVVLSLFGLPMLDLVPGVSYALTLVFSYGLVYGLGQRFFVGPKAAPESELDEWS